MFCFRTFASPHIIVNFQQDQFVHENYLYNVKGGTFVDVGAHNGISLSNSYFFETELGWKGICVEPIPRAFGELQKNRNSILVQGCVTDFSVQGEFLLITHGEIPGNGGLAGTPEMLSGLLNKFDPRHLEEFDKPWLLLVLAVKS